MQWRSTVLFAAGSIVGGAAVLMAYLTYVAPTVPKSTVYSQATMEPAGRSAPSPKAAAPQVSPMQAAGGCPTPSTAVATGAGDGQFQLARALAAQPLPEANAFLHVAREAAQQGRQRDAEVAYIAACHVAEQASGARSAPVADVKSQLGQHYVALARAAGDEAARDQLLQQASTLFSEGAATYAAALGRNASKTRLAEQRLAALSDPALRDPLLRAPAPAPVDVAGGQPSAPDTSRLGSARLSLADRPPARTEDLGKVDGDIERLYAQVHSVSRDPAGVQRRHQQALAQRSNCRGDEECLRQWAAQRKRQLFAEF